MENFYALLDQIGWRSDKTYYWWNSSSDNDKVLAICDEIKESGERRRHYKRGHWSRMMKGPLNLTDLQIAAIFSGYIQFENSFYERMLYWHVDLLISQIERMAKETPLTNERIELLMEMKDMLAKSRFERGETGPKEQAKLIEWIDRVIYNDAHRGVAAPEFFDNDDDLGKLVNTHVANANEKERTIWHRLIAHARTASGPRPSKKYLADGAKLTKQLGDGKFSEAMNLWMEFMAGGKRMKIDYGGYEIYVYFKAINLDLIKGFVWLLTGCDDKATLLSVASLAQRSLHKDRGAQKPYSEAVGNACLYVLSEARGIEGIGHIFRIRKVIYTDKVIKTIDKYLEAAAKNAGLTAAELEDMTTEDYELEDGKRTFDFDGYKAVVQVSARGKVVVEWNDASGIPQKGAPAGIKEKYKWQLSSLNSTVKLLELSASAQKSRIDSMFRKMRTLSWSNFERYWFRHGLVSVFSRQLIWSFKKGKKVTACFWSGNAWIDCDGKLFGDDMEQYEVSLWHPANSDAKEVSKWRSCLSERMIQQPVKQAYREVYAITEAEKQTAVYSNRMAAHILKQHVFRALANARRWKFEIIGVRDDGRANDAAFLALPEQAMIAEFWVNRVNRDEQHYVDWTYISSDKVRFVSSETNESVALNQVPPIVFSEVMRDADLFVGVASVANDPTWADTGGLPEYRNYFHTYSFGDLSEAAKTRKEVLQDILPKLKIASQVSINGNFVVVKGKLGIYKIHIGSTNILMAPNDQYLCIVPARTKAIDDKIFLPFDGDNALSLIISKATLLTADDKIKDEAIMSQIKGR